MKVFQIGFNKCATSSIWMRLDALGFTASHLKTNNGIYVASVMIENLHAGRHILDGLDDYDAFTFVEGYKLYPQILEQVPDAVFILNVRDRESWIKSRMAHNDGTYAAALMRIAGAASLDELADQWRADWDAHVAAVQATIPADKLMVLNVDRQNVAEIDDFLGRKPIKYISNTPQNFTRSGFSKTLSRLTPKWVKAALPKELNRAFHYLLRRRH